MTQEAFKPSVQEPVGQTPLREFKGTLTEYLPEERTCVIAGAERAFVDVKARAQVSPLGLSLRCITFLEGTLLPPKPSLACHVCPLPLRPNHLWPPVSIR